MRINYYTPPENAAQLEGCPIEQEGGYKVSTVKALIKKYGGTGYSLHCDKGGSVQEVSEIKANGNNAVSLTHCVSRGYSV